MDSEAPISITFTRDQWVEIQSLARWAHSELLEGTRTDDERTSADLLAALRSQAGIPDED
jgi:predicted metal-dependent HD superfamily phosphohydrolase